jgi:hypothetical protein
MLATWFFAYSEGLTSTRKLERQCRRDVHYLYVSGRLHPDHCSLSRFRARHLDRMPDYFLQMLLLAKRRGLTTFADIGIDGTVMQASASAKRSKDSEGLARLLDRVRRRIDTYLARCQREDEVETEDEALEAVEDRAALQAELARLQALDATIMERQAQLEARKKTLKAEHRARHQINLTEAEATNHAGNPGYNAQVAVDLKTRLIVSADVVTDRNDRGQLLPQYEQVEQHLGPNPERSYTVDAGYHSLEALEQVAERQIDVVINDPTPQQRSPSVAVPMASAAALLEADKPLVRSDFRYDAEADCYVCPGGDQLVFTGEQKRKERTLRLYRAGSCSGCVLKALCLSPRNKSGLRTVVRDAQEDLAEQMLLRLQDPAARDRLARRFSTVEPVIGNVKWNLGLRRFRLRGLAKVRGEFVLMCVGHNLNKLFGLLEALGCFFRSFVVGFLRASLWKYKTRGALI